MKQILIILIGLLIYADGKSCECRDEERDISVTKALLYSDIIFCGEFISGDTSNPFVEAYKFKILELFKGKYSKNIIFGCYYVGCSIIPHDKGLWIVYAEQVNDSTISISKCSPSIPIIQAERLVSSSFFDNYIKTHGTLIIDKTQILENRTKGLSLWFAELEKLRQYKKAHNIVSKKVDLKIILILCLILMNITLISIVIITMRK
ncbi:MAG: hypothetical protein NTY07_00940 [Bacteroidia bacterium]|nr:hypothetical protein [Bacteroidia bacterium]